MIPLGQSVNYTCAVNAGRTEWAFGPGGQYTLNTYHVYSGIIPLDENINVNLSSYTDEGDSYVTILTIPSSLVLQLNDTDVTCKVKPSAVGTSFGPRYLRIQVFGELCFAFCKLLRCVAHLDVFICQRSASFFGLCRFSHLPW